MNNQECIALLDQKSNRILVFDIKDNNWNNDSVIWEWKTSNKRYINNSDVKLRKSQHFGGDVVITCASYGYIAIISYPNGEVLWETTADGNLHSVELLPNGNIAVAASDGNYIRIYSVFQKSCNFVEVELEQAHGVLWDPDNNILWGLGKTQLIAYEIGGTLQSPTMSKLMDLSAYIPTHLSDWGHDLAPVYGDKNRLWITVSKNILQYDKTQRVFITDYIGHEHINCKNAKGVGNTPNTNHVVTVYPNKTHPPWCTNIVNLISTEPDINVMNRISDTCAYYKARVWSNNYQ